MYAVQIIGGIIAICALLGWLLLRVWMSQERLEANQRYRRRFLKLVIVVWGGYCVFGVIEVFAGKQPIESLIGLPFVLGFLWIALRSISMDKQKSN